MRKKRNNRFITSSNLDNATPEQLDRVYTNVAQAVSTMYRKVVQRKWEEELKKSR